MTKIFHMMFVKHKKYRDTCMYVMKVFDTGHSYKLKIQWFNLGTENSYDMGIKQNVIIEYSDLPNWQWTTLDETNLRTADWKEFA